MTSRARRELTNARKEVVVQDVRNVRAAGVRLDGEAIAAALEALPDRQRQVMQRALEQLRAGRRRPNLSAIARDLGIARQTAQDAYDLAAINLGLALT